MTGSKKQIEQFLGLAYLQATMIKIISTAFVAAMLAASSAFAETTRAAQKAQPTRIQWNALIWPR